uniref:Uncharacterized protein n=1 Tax=Acrobeloides nanus TaxID=290746 RepID=A0A914CCE5_9BILA
MYDTFMGLHASRGNIPNWIYGRNGDIQVDISEVIEDTDLFVTLARDKKGSQFIQQKFPNDRELCAFLFECLLESDLIFPLSKDVFGNFVIQ